MPHTDAAGPRNLAHLHGLAKLCIAIAITGLLLGGTSWCQSRTGARAQESHSTVALGGHGKVQNDWLQEIDKKYPGLLNEFANLQSRFSKEIQYPGPRLQSRLLPLLPDSTVFYIAIPNYGDTLHQAIQIFDQELKESAVLHDWFQHTDFAASWPKVREGLGKTYELSQYLGDEIVLSASMDGKEPGFLVLAESRKPGLAALIPQFEKMLDEKARPSLRVFDPEQLTAAKENVTGAILLVRSDLVVLGSDFAYVRKFNSQSQSQSRKFASTELGDRLAQGYHDGAILLGGIDLQKLLSQIPMKTAQDRSLFQSTGAGDLKFATWKHSQSSGQAASEAELTFSGTRRGIASWLAASGPFESLELISPKAAMVASLRLKSPADIFEDVKNIAGSANPGSLAMLSQMEQGLGIDLKQDLLSKLTGELTIESDTPQEQEPEWKVILGVTDPNSLQQTLNGLLARAGVPVQQYQAGGLSFYSVRVPNGPKPLTVHYTFAGGYMLVAPSSALITEALQMRASGTSLAKSRAFIDSLPHGHSAIASGIFYQNFGASMARSMKQLSPDISRLLAGLKDMNSPVTMCVYGEDRAIREVSTGGNMDIATIGLIGAAIAIPNLLHSKVAANEAAAAATLRTVNTAQVTYATSYPGRRYAPDLATLGPGFGGCATNEVSPKHACLLDSSLGAPSCTAGRWCAKNSYRFTVAGACHGLTCGDYVAVATPANASGGTKNYCSVSDFKIRSKNGPPLSSAVSPAECRLWPPIR